MEQLDRTIQYVGEDVEKAYIETLKELKQIENKTKEINERGYD